MPSRSSRAVAITRSVPPSATVRATFTVALGVIRDRHGLHRQAFHDEVERLAPLGRQVEQVGHHEFDGRVREALAGHRDCGRGDIEADHLEPALGDELRVGAEPAPDDERAPARAVEIPCPRLEERMGPPRSHGRRS